MPDPSEQVEAAVKPELLVWAREGAGLEPEEAARRVEITLEQLHSWEKGERRPSLNQLRDLGRVYTQPIAVFFLPRPPKELQATHDFPRRLAALREDRHLTRRALAEKAGVHTRQIRRYEAGLAQPRLDVFCRLALALGVSADTLLFDPDGTGPLDDPGPMSLDRQPRRR